MVASSPNTHPAARDVLGTHTPRAASSSAARRPTDRTHAGGPALTSGGRSGPADGAGAPLPTGRPIDGGYDPDARRPLRSRQTPWARAAAHGAVRLGLSPNAISLASVGCAALAGGALAMSAGAEAPVRAGLLLLAAAGIQSRLLCNLLDGMVAVEGGKGTPSGAVYNELPDRFADTLIFVGAGASIGWVSWGWTLGWAVALVAVLTAYVRVLGASLGAGHHFAGPMAKQERMAALTAACVGSAILVRFDPAGALMTVSLVLIGAGSLVTVVRRTRLVVRAVEDR